MSFEGYFGYNPHRANYLTHVSERHSAVFVEVPKAGCTTVKTVLQYSEVKGDTSLLPQDVHLRATSPLRDALNTGLDADLLFGASSQFFRFAFVRNPFTRILSCYKDKIAGSQWERDRRLPQLGFARDADVSFTTFLETVLRQPTADMDIHWAPQAFLLGIDRVSYDYLGRQETFAQDLRRVIARLDLMVPEGAVETRPHATNAGADLSRFYDETTTALVRRIYARDFVTFGYGQDPQSA